MSALLDTLAFLDAARRRDCEAHDAADREADMAHHRRHQGASLRHLAYSRPSAYALQDPAHYEIDIDVPGHPPKHIEGFYPSDLAARLVFVSVATPGAMCTLARNGELLEVVGRVA